ncbi:uncharacterized protein [Triticum aestivum]|uniref:uncharacterized protein n=1 Tax=Triticum aestivum TaxID=4565 RepID=UPI001D00E006|nr:uncharacterized protein LOC123142025 [Triticum aestivum]
MNMWEKIRGQIMHRMYDYANTCENKWTGNICPKIVDKMRKNEDYASDCFTYPSGQRVYEVKSKDNTYEVKMNEKTCDCRRWQLTAIPCSHAISCMRKERIKPETQIASFYTRERYMKAYENTVWPVRDKSFWEKTHGRDVGAPLYEKEAGRKSNKRREHPSEKEEGTRLSKHGVKMHCSFCRDPNHKRPSFPELHPELKLEPQRRTNDDDNVGDPSVVENIVSEEGNPELIPTQCSRTFVVEVMEEEVRIVLTIYKLIYIFCMVLM